MIYILLFCSTNTSSISIMIASASIIRKCLGYFSLNLNELDLNRPIGFQPLTKWKNIALGNVFYFGVNLPVWNAVNILKTIVKLYNTRFINWDTVPVNADIHSHMHYEHMYTNTPHWNVFTVSCQFLCQDLNRHWNRYCPREEAFRWWSSAELEVSHLSWNVTAAFSR